MQDLHLPTFDVEFEVVCQKLKCHTITKSKEHPYLAKFSEEWCRYLGYLISPNSGLGIICQMSGPVSGLQIWPHCKTS